VLPFGRVFMPETQKNADLCGAQEKTINLNMMCCSEKAEKPRIQAIISVCILLFPGITIMMS
jgi:hypothetical protein